MIQVQGICLILNDPLSLPCVVAHLESCVRIMKPETASVVGVARFDEGEPLLTKVGPPVTANLLNMLPTIYSRVLLVAVQRTSVKALPAADVQPFRYRNWSFLMSGAIGKYVPPDETVLAIPTYIQKNIRGQTMPEVLFHQFLAFLHRQGLLEGDRLDMAPLRKALRSALSLEQAWFWNERPDNSLVVTDGTILLGATLGRPVYVQQIEGIQECLACGGDIDGRPVAHPFVRGVAIVDTDLFPPGDWRSVGPDRVFQVSRDLKFETFKL